MKSSHFLRICLKMGWEMLSRLLTVISAILGDYRGTHSARLALVPERNAYSAQESISSPVQLLRVYPNLFWNGAPLLIWNWYLWGCPLPLASRAWKMAHNYAYRSRTGFSVFDIPCGTTWGSLVEYKAPECTCSLHCRPRDTYLTAIFLGLLWFICFLYCWTKWSKKIAVSGSVNIKLS